MVAVQGLGQGLDSRLTGPRQGVRCVAARAQHGSPIGDGRRIQAARVITGQRERADIGGVPGLLLIVQAKDVELVVAVGITVVHPAGGGFGSRPAPGAVAGAAVHFIRHRKDDVRARQKGAAGITHGHPHHRIRILRVGIVVRRDRNAFAGENASRRIEGHDPRNVARSGHGVPGEPDIFGEGNTEEGQDVLPEIRLADRGRIVGPGRVGDRLVGHGHARGIGDQVSRGVDDLRKEVVVGRQDREDGKVGVHAVHPEVVPGDRAPDRSGSRDAHRPGGQKQYEHNAKSSRAHLRLRGHQVSRPTEAYEKRRPAS